MEMDQDCKVREEKLTGNFQLGRKMLFCPYIRDAWWGSMVSFHVSEGAMYPEWNHPVRVSVTPAPCYLFR